MLYIYINVNFIFFFIRFDFLAVIYIHCQIKRLVFYFLALNVCSWCRFLLLSGGLLGHFLRHAHRHIIFLLFRELLLFLFRIKILADIESISALFRKLVFLVAVHLFKFKL